MLKQIIEMGDMSVRSKIFNPNKLSPQEQAFVDDAYSSEKKSGKFEKKEKFKKIMLSIPEMFLEELNEYLSMNPREGTRSAFFVRVVALYIEEKKRNSGV